MQRLIESLLEWQAMERQTVPELELYGCGVKQKTSYWLIIHGFPELTPELQAHWLASCKKAVKDPALEKNTNLLLTWKVEALDHQTSILVQQIEEDSYFFKKHVLPYTVAELNELKLQVEKIGLESVFSSFIMDTQTFTSYKRQFHEGGWQNLLYRIAIKLSALRIQDTTTANLDSLEYSIQDQIGRSSDASDLKAIESTIMTLAKEKDPLEELEPDELLELVVNRLEEVSDDSKG